MGYGQLQELFNNAQICWVGNVQQVAVVFRPSFEDFVFVLENRSFVFFFGAFSTALGTVNLFHASKERLYPSCVRA